MDQTSQAAAVLVPIMAAVGVTGMLTVFGLASRTRPVPRPTPPPIPHDAEAPGAGGVLVSQWKASVPVS